MPVTVTTSACLHSQTPNLSFHLQTRLKSRRACGTGRSFLATGHCQKGRLIGVKSGQSGPEPSPLASNCSCKHSAGIVQYFRLHIQRACWRGCRENGQAMGKTPVTVSLSDFDLTFYRITLTKMGYRDRTVTLEKELKPGAFPGGFIVWPFWLWCHGPMDTYRYKLEPAEIVRPVAVSVDTHDESSSDNIDLERDMPDPGRKNFTPTCRS